MARLSEDEQQDIQVFNKQAWSHSSYFELWKVVWLLAGLYFGWNVATELLTGIRDWWHYKSHERDTVTNLFMLGGLFISWIAYGVCADEEKSASAGHDLSRRRESWLRQRASARERGDTEALKEKPFKRYGFLKFLGWCILAGGLLVYYSTRD